jgi:hypothetical protein
MGDAQIDLMYFEGVGLLFKCSTGVRFTSQVGGLGCLHPVDEGVFCPLPVDRNDELTQKLRRVFGGSWHPATESQANQLDQILADAHVTEVRVDRTRMSDSFEAWVHVVMGPPAARLVEVVPHPPSTTAILVWANSD